MSVFAAESTSASIQDLVGEGKKYSTVDDLAKAYVNADKFIVQLKTENEGMREDLSQRKTAEQILEEIRKPVTPPAIPAQESTPPAAPQAINEDALINRLQERLSQDQVRQRQSANVDEVAKTLIETFGSEAKANEVVQNKARELGVSVQFLQDAAAQSPKAFYQTLGLDVAQTPAPGAPKGTVNPAALGANVQVKEGSYKWYENLRKTDPSAYWKPQIQKQLMKDALSKGDDFYT